MFKSLISWITGSTVGAVASGVEKVGGVFAENREAKGQRSHQADMAILAQFAAEFHERKNRTRMDSVADALNRIPRPLIALSIIGLFLYAPVNPVRMLEIAAAYEGMPNGFWTLLSIVVAFYFGGRMQIKSQDFAIKGGALAAAKDMIEQRKTFRELIADDEDQLPGVETVGGNAVVQRWLSRKTETS